MRNKRNGRKENLSSPLFSTRISKRSSPIMDSFQEEPLILLTLVYNNMPPEWHFHLEDCISLKTIFDKNIFVRCYDYRLLPFRLFVEVFLSQSHTFGCYHSMSSKWVDAATMKWNVSGWVIVKCRGGFENEAMVWWVLDNCDGLNGS